jgi:hypothetical protein
MDFFLDTGPIYGFLATNDRSHHRDCAKFFRDYPLGIHNYYTSKIIIEKELQNVRRKRLCGADQLLRTVEQRARVVLSSICDVDYRNHALFKLLFSEILDLLDSKKTDANPKDRDAGLLANAFLWDQQMIELYNPNFMTIDERDIGNNRQDITDTADKCLCIQSRLKIYLVREIVRSV